MKIVGLLIVAIALPLKAATYYVDFDTGVDSNNGTSTNTPWKHCSGDANATGTALTVASTAAAGDSFTFKGGVVYRGSIRLQRNGANGNPIQFNGNSGWGTGQAILSGSELIGTSWTQCVSSNEVRGNPLYTNIWWTTLPSAPLDWFTELSAGDTQYYFSQHPNPSDFLAWQELDSFHTAATGEVTLTNLVSTAYLTQTDTNFYAGSQVYVWTYGNELTAAPITSFDTSTHTISFSLSAPAVLYVNGITYWKILNHPYYLDTQGEYCIQTANETKLFFFSTNGAPQNIEIARRAGGVIMSGNNYHTWDGFKIRGVCAGQSGFGAGGGFVTGGGGLDPCIGVTFQNSTVLNCNSPNSVLFAVGMYGIGMTVSNCAVYNCLNRGVVPSGTNVYLGHCGITNLSGSGLYTAGTNITVEYNNFVNVRGIHANGCSTYNCTNTIVLNNYLFNCRLPLTFENSRNLAFIGNLVDCNNQDQRIQENGGGDGYCRWLNNSLINNSNHSTLIIGTGGHAYLLENNIIDGGGPPVTTTNTVRDHNIYTGLMFYQDPMYNWSYGTGEFTTNNAALFVNPGTDWRLKSGSPAIDAGTNTSGYGVSSDINGISRPQGSAFDVGAYEFLSGQSAASPWKRRIKKW